MSFITKGNFSSLECTLIVLINIHMYFGVNLNTKSMKWMCLEFTSKLIKIRQIWMNYALPRNFTSFDTRPLPLSLPHPQTINIDSILSVIGQHNYSIMDYRILTDLFHTVVNRKLCYHCFLGWMISIYNAMASPIQEYRKINFQPFIKIRCYR